MRDYKKIKAFQLGDTMVLKVYKLTKTFPNEEKFGLTSQLRRAVLSVPTNIVEGANRQHKKEYLQFLYISHGSLSEAEYLLHLAHKLNYITDKDFEEIDRLREETAMTLYGLIKSVQNETT